MVALQATKCESESVWAMHRGLWEINCFDLLNCNGQPKTKIVYSEERSLRFEKWKDQIKKTKSIRLKQIYLVGSDVVLTFRIVEYFQLLPFSSVIFLRDVEDRPTSGKRIGSTQIHRFRPQNPRSALVLLLLLLSNMTQCIRDRSTCIFLSPYRSVLMKLHSCVEKSLSRGYIYLLYMRVMRSTHRSDFEPKMKTMKNEFNWNVINTHQGRGERKETYQPSEYARYPGRWKLVALTNVLFRILLCFFCWFNGIPHTHTQINALLVRCYWSEDFKFASTFLVSHHY